MKSWKAAAAVAGLVGAGLVLWDHYQNGETWFWERPPFVSTRKLSVDQKIRMQVQSEIARREAEQRAKEEFPTGRYAGWVHSGQRWQK